MLKVCHVITGLDTGGAESALLRLVASLPQADFEQSVIALLPDGALTSSVRALAPVRHLGCARGRFGFAAARMLRHALHDMQPDVIHGWMYHANLAVTISAFPSRAKVIWGIRHSLDDLSSERRSTRLAIRAGAPLSRSAWRIVYNSSTSAAQHVAIGYSARRMLVIPNGFCTEKFRPDHDARQRLRTEWNLNEETLVIGLIARVHPVKDHSNFLRAAALFVREHPAVCFVLVGDGADCDNEVLRRDIDALGLWPCVRLCGRRNDVAAVNCAIDVGVCASWSEAFPNAIAEAMACATPCVATDVGDVRAIVGDTGVVVQRRDPEAMAAGWAALAALGKAKRCALGARARARIKSRYSMGATVAEYASLYAAAANGS